MSILVGGTDNSIQYNRKKLFAGDSYLTWNDGTKVFTVTGQAKYGSTSDAGTDPEDFASRGYVDSVASGVAGSDTQVQYNDDGDMGADANLTWNDATQVLTVDGTAKVGDISGGNYTEIESDGTMVAHGDATTYEDLQITMGEIAGGGWWGDDWCDIVEYRSGVALEFENSTSSKYKVRFNAQVMHAYHTGEDIEFHIHVGNDGTSTGTAVFKLTYEWASFEETYGSASTATQSFSIDGTDGKHQYEHIADITGTGKGISSILLCQLERDAGHADDNFSGSVYVIGVDFHIPINTLGSRTATSK